MKFTRMFLLTISLLMMVVSSFAQVKVRGYYRKDGTYVRPHYRSSPDGNPYNNWSYPGNTNPYTGKTATGNPSTYLKNYYNRSSSGSSSSTYNYPATTYSPSSSSGYSGISNAYTTCYVTANTLNIRSGPSTNYSVIGSLSQADNVKVIESYSGGWKRIEYSYFDSNSFSLVTKTGYVSGDYLSTSHPLPNNSLNYQDAFNTMNSNFPSLDDVASFNSSSSSPNTTYSNLNANSSPYGYGNGNITIWTDCGNDGEIKVYLDGSYIGKLTQYFNGEAPDCEEDGTLSINKPAGTYTLEAKGSTSSWSGTITISRDNCLVQGLRK